MRPPAAPRPLPPATLAHVLPPNLDHEYFRDGALHPFRPEARGFAPINGWWLAEAALLTYAPEDFAVPSFHAAGWRVEGEAAIAGESTLCYVLSAPDAVIVAFRGTRAFKPGAAVTRDALGGILADVLTDVRVGLVPFAGGGRVHRGFLAALEQVWDDRVAPCLRRLQDARPDRGCWFTGHSLGGALATLAAARWEQTAGLYTFGSPLVGDQAFARAFTPPGYRIVNNTDVVPLVPRVGPCGTGRVLRVYHHVGRLKYIAADGRLLDRPSRLLRAVHGIRDRGAHLVDVAAAWRDAAPAPLPDAGFNDHAPLYYALHMWNAYARTRARLRLVTG